MSIDHAKMFLANYLRLQQLQRQEKLELEQLAEQEPDASRIERLCKEVDACEKEMQWIEEVINGTPFCDCYLAFFTDEQTFLRYRFLNGLSVEATADKMKMSRDTAFRLQKKAFAMIQTRLDRLEKEKIIR